MQKYSIIVTTCDKFSDLWQNNLFLFDKFWPNHPQIILISDKPNGLGDSLPCSFLHFPGEYTERLRATLTTVRDDYVFLTLDDYLPSNEIDQKRMNRLLDYMSEHNISYLRLFNRTKTKGWIDRGEGIHLLPLTKETYEVNLYPSFWKTSELKKMLQYNENPWKFEVRLTRRAKEKNLFCGWVSNKKLFPFQDTIRKGKYLRKAYKFLKTNNLYISNRPIRSIKETISLNFRTFVGRHVPQKLKNFLKKLTHKQYYSDFANFDD